MLVLDGIIRMLEVLFAPLIFIPLSTIPGADIGRRVGVCVFISASHKECNKQGTNQYSSHWFLL